MARTYWYRFSKTTWGIFIGLTAEVVPHALYTGPAIEAAEGLWLAAVPPMWGGTPMADRPELRYYLTVGLRLVADQMRGPIQKQGPLVVRVLTLEFAATDYQDEGLACAIAGWLAEEYYLDYSPPPVYYDPEQNRYQFIFPDWALRPLLDRPGASQPKSHT